MANVVEGEEKLIQEQIEKKTEGRVDQHGFGLDGKHVHGEKGVEPLAAQACFPPETVRHLLAERNKEHSPERQMTFSELSELCEVPPAVKAKISLDDVCWKKQKAEGRKKSSLPKDTREMVSNTVAPLQNGESKTSRLNTPHLTHMMTLVLAFLCRHGLLSLLEPLVFLIDGARNLRSAIQGRFRFLPFTIIVDWDHLEKSATIS